MDQRLTWVPFIVKYEHITHRALLNNANAYLNDRNKTLMNKMSLKLTLKTESLSSKLNHYAFSKWAHWIDLPLREKCPTAELFLASIFLYSDWIRIFTPQISIFSPNTGKYGPEITPYLDTFHGVCYFSSWISTLCLLNDVFFTDV